MLMVRGEQELRAAVGRDLGPTTWRDITPADIEAFASALGCRALPRMRELYLLSLGGRFSYELIVIEPVVLFVLYGYGRVCFDGVLPVRARVRMRLRVTRIRERLGSALLTITQIFECEGEAEPACVADAMFQIEWVRRVT
jgi:acyl dehydratase